MKNFEKQPFAEVHIVLDIEFAPLAGDVLQLLDVAANIVTGLPDGLQRKRLERRIRKLIRKFEVHLKTEQEELDEDQGNDHRPSGNGDTAGHSDDE